MVNILNWKYKYIDPCVLDGTHWSLKIVTEEKTIKKYGDKQFPDEWDLLC